MDQNEKENNRNDAAVCGDTNCDMCCDATKNCDARTNGANCLTISTDAKNASMSTWRITAMW